MIIIDFKLYHVIRLLIPKRYMMNLFPINKTYIIFESPNG